MDLRLLVHSDTIKDMTKRENISVFEGDLLKPESLDGFLKPGCTIINLVYLRSGSERDNLAAMTNLAIACRSVRIKRLIHCSTAMVVGHVSEDNITEETRCHPSWGYETIKYKTESLLKDLSARHFELVILRPTAVFGRGGKNLLKLADDLSHGNRAVNYLKSCLFNQRRMNLVFVDNVVAALIFLTDSDRKMNGDIFIVSDDDDPMNNYRDVERLLMRRLGCRDYTIPRLPMPGFALEVFLALAGKSNVNPNRKNHFRKIINAGFKKVSSLESGLDSFVDWYKQQYNSAFHC
jgi:nucleoside-diphosphate-sugar epimerase